MENGGVPQSVAGNKKNLRLTLKWQASHGSTTIKVSLAVQLLKYTRTQLTTENPKVLNTPWAMKLN